MGGEVVSFKFLPCMHIYLQSMFRCFLLLCVSSKTPATGCCHIHPNTVKYEYSTSCNYWIVLSTLQAP
jgi:hypothetical protein